MNHTILRDEALMASHNQQKRVRYFKNIQDSRKYLGLLEILKNIDLNTNSTMRMGQFYRGEVFMASQNQ